ncbi:hypothetical protein Pint_09738 [Pistacia integerrima]|uniref:Uncharacterized protein n=1 Tax=Pistacia integerrima TaxID=434235 RepID=A0ACC0XKC1_9ROSI|nr:hypothetical protein Pint_09738 [Pistacia integerrima]
MAVIENQNWWVLDIDRILSWNLFCKRCRLVFLSLLDGKLGQFLLQL